MRHRLALLLAGLSLLTAVACRTTSPPRQDRWIAFRYDGGLGGGEVNGEIRRRGFADVTVTKGGRRAASYEKQLQPHEIALIRHALDRFKERRARRTFAEVFDAPSITVRVTWPDGTGMELYDGNALQDCGGDAAPLYEVWHAIVHAVISAQMDQMQLADCANADLHERHD